MLHFKFENKELELWKPKSRPLIKTQIYSFDNEVNQTKPHCIIYSMIFFLQRCNTNSWFSSILGHLRPSRELLEYYRKKIAEYDDEHEQLVSKLEEYRVAYEEQVV